MSIKNNIISFWKQVRLKSSDMFSMFKIGIGVKVPTHKLHVKDATDPIKIEGLQNDTTDPDKFLTIDSNNIVKYRTGSEVLSDIGGTPLTTEEVQDIAGGLVATGGTKTGITITYDDANNNMDFVVDHDAATNYVANEHLRWDTNVSSTATIDTNNIPDLHGAGVDGAANQVLTDNGDGTVTSEAGLKWDGNNLNIQSATSTKPVIIINNTNADAEAPEIQLVKGTGGADSDDLGKIKFEGFDDGGNEQTFAQVLGEIQVAADGSEEGRLTLSVASHDGELQPGLRLDSGNVEDEVDVSLGNGAASVTTINGTIVVGSTLFSDNSGVIQVATQGTIDHDSLANFVANEHIDWTGSSAGTIHSTNIPTLNQDTTGNAATATNLTAGDKTLGGVYTAKGYIVDGDRNITPSGDGVALHLDAQDITDTSTSASGTASFYNHAVFENPRVFATNASVTTTEANTVYIKGAPVAGTNQTLTTANSLKVAGGNVDFAADLAVGANLNVTGIITGKQRQIYQQSFIDDLGANNKHYLPWRDTDEQTTIYQEEAAMIAPYDGRIVSVTMRISSVSGTGTRTLAIHTLGPNTSQFTTSNWTEEEAEDASISSTDDNHVYYFVFDNAKHFESGELVTLSIIDDTDLTASHRYTYISTVVEWDYNNGLGTGTSSAEFDSAQ
tara:strand:- start:1828 stop:3837 length:2010 start_codon:yes stop_codon:yes gene_type:complete